MIARGLPGRARLRTAVGWLAVVALIELVTRAVVYGLASAPPATAEALRGQLGGPRLALVALVALGLAAALATAVVWMAGVAVEERWRVAAPRAAGPRPARMALAPIARRAVALWLAGCLVFAAVESYVHWRAGLGFHGLTCLVGPVHRDALPVVAALALVAAAAVAAAQHVLAWMRRTVAAIFARRPLPRPRAGLGVVVLDRAAPSRVPLALLRARPPPVRSA